MARCIPSETDGSVSVGLHMRRNICVSYTMYLVVFTYTRLNSVVSFKACPKTLNTLLNWDMEVFEAVNWNCSCSILESVTTCNIHADL